MSLFRSDDSDDAMKNRPLVLLDNTIVPCENPQPWREWFYEFTSRAYASSVSDQRIAEWQHKALDEGLPEYPLVRLGDPSAYVDRLIEANYPMDHRGNTDSPPPGGNQIVASWWFPLAVLGLLVAAAILLWKIGHAGAAVTIIILVIPFMGGVLYRPSSKYSLNQRRGDKM